MRQCLLIVGMLFSLHVSAQSWAPLSPAGTSPAGRGYFAYAYNPNNNRLMVFGGALNWANVPTLANDVWVLTNADGTTGAPGWQPLAPAGTAPAARAYAPAVYDTNNNRMIIFGGDTSVGYCNADVNDVWVLTNADGSTGTPGWVQLSPTGGPPSARAEGTMVYDQAGNNAILYSGNNSCDASLGDVWVLSHANGLGGTPVWTQLSPSGTAPAPHSNGNAGYDQVNNLMIIFGGLTAAGATNDVWILSHANGSGGTPAWSQLTAANSSPPRYNALGAYDSGSNILTVCGGITLSDTNDVWQLSHANGLGGTPVWTQVNPAYTPPSPRDGLGGGYRPATRQLIVYGGLECTSGCVVDSDAWALNLTPTPAPVIFSFTPTNGMAGTTVTISGTNLTTLTEVTFNGLPTTFFTNASAQIVALAPACAGTGPIAIANPGGDSTTTNNFFFTRQPAVTVNSLTETGLEDALCNGSTITFAGNGTINITSVKIISSDTVLDGTGYNVTISGNGSTGIFAVNGGTHLTLRNLTIANGYTASVGGGLVNGGVAELDNCTFSNNVTQGLANGDGEGGAIYNGFFGTLTVNGCTFVNNRAEGGPGTNGVSGASEYAAGGPGGEGGIGMGGAIGNDGYTAITNCTFYGNQAVGGNGGQGGEGYNGYTTEYICGSYRCGFNTCYDYCTEYIYGGPGGEGGEGGVGYGGNIYNNAVGLAAVNSTFANGSASGGAAGVPGPTGAYGSGYGAYGFAGTGVGGNLGAGSAGLVLKNCIVANAAAGQNYWGGAIVDAGNNLSSDASLVFTNATSFTNANPNLGTLTNNGGTTFTMALLPASPAVRAGSTNGAPTTDQRGQPRKALQIDLGAYETAALTSSLPSVVLGTLPAGQSGVGQSGIGQFILGFTNMPGTSFSIWSSTNLIFDNWLFVGFAREVVPGQFQFIDTTLTNNPDKFYRIQSP